jgi:hypothetical protein
MADTEPKRLDKGEFKTLVERHPGVQRRLQKPVACTGFMTTGFSFKRRREGRLRICKKPAYWTFQPLAWREGRNSARRPAEHYCWTHLIYRGVFGNMEEEARTFRWLRRLGYVVEFDYEER